MNFTQYQDLAERTMPADVTKRDRLAIGGLGIAGEAGECADIVKKHLFHGHPLDEMKLAKELGDVLWYLSALASAIDFDLAMVARLNIDKLRERYPDGFSSEASLNRAQ